MADAGAIVAWLARAALFAGALASLGGCVLAVLARRVGVDRPIPAPRLTSLVMLAMLLVLGERQVAAFIDPGDSRWAVTWTLLRYTPFGMAWAMQGVGTLGLMVVPPRRAGVRLVLALAVTAGFPFSGHAVAASPAALGITSDFLHVAAAGAWLGTLALLLVWIGRMPAPAASRLVEAFSPIALVAAGVLVATGVVSSLLHVTQFADLWATSYGRLLSAKLAAVLVTMGAGAWNWRVNRIRLRDRGDDAALRRTMAIEVAGALVALLVTAALVHTDPNAGRF